MQVANPAWVSTLASLVKGTVATRQDPLFHDTISIFNAARKSPAEAVVLVLDAKDVSAVVQFALANSLSISVKSGGYNVAGWSIMGDIIIDLVALDSITVHTPDALGLVQVPSLSADSAFGKAPTSLDRRRKRSEGEAFDVQAEADSSAGDRRSSGSNPSPFSFDNLPLPTSPPLERLSTSAQMSRSNSHSSSTTRSAERSGSGSRSVETGETSGEGSGSNLPSPELHHLVDARGKGKGKERDVAAAEMTELERIRLTTNGGRGVPRDVAHEGTRSWVANQARDEAPFARRPNVADDRPLSNLPQRASGLPYASPIYHAENSALSYATSFFDRTSPGALASSSSSARFPFPATASSSQPPPGFPSSGRPVGMLDAFPRYPPFDNASSGIPSMPPGFGGISSAGFFFNPAAMAGPTSSGFVFNTAALASSSNLVPAASTASVVPTPAKLTSPRTSPITTNPPQPPPSTTTRPNSTSPRSAMTFLPAEAASLPSASGSNTSPASTSSPVPSALVTIGAGAKSKQIDAATSQFSYHVPLAAYPVGCAIFASGGFGFLSRLHGLSMDNVVEVEMVLPSGRILYLKEMGEVQEGEDEETQEMRRMWWAYRGAGLALGIITRVRAKAFHTGLVYSGNLIYPFNPITTPSLIKHWRDCCKNAPRELYMNLILTAGPTPAQHVVVIQLCYVGPRSEGDQFLQNIMSWEGEVCLLKDVETRTFMTQQDSVVQILSAQAGNRWCIRADLMNSLPDECIHKTVAAFKNIPERSAWLFEIAAGAIADVDPESSCFPASHRSAPFQVAAIHQWKAAADDDLWTNAARNWIDSTISPHSPGGSYPCFLESREGLAKIRNTFGPTNWARLVDIKKKVDPTNLMKNNFWPDPKDGEDASCTLCDE